MGTVLSTEFYSNLTIFLMLAKQQVMNVGAEFGLSSVQTLTLLMLDDAEAPTMSGLCRRFDCDASNITGIIDGLEQKGVVSRQASPKDRRVKIIRIEPEGKQMQKAILERLAAKSDHVFADLEPAEKDQFASLIQKLASGRSLL